MPLKIRCPKCQKALVVPLELAGKRGKCPACCESFSITPSQVSNVPAEAHDPSLLAAKHGPRVADQVQIVASLNTPLLSVPSVANEATPPALMQPASTTPIEVSPYSTTSYGTGPIPPAGWPVFPSVLTLPPTVVSNAQPILTPRVAPNQGTISRKSWLWPASPKRRRFLGLGLGAVIVGSLLLLLTSHNRREQADRRRTPPPNSAPPPSRVPPISQPNANDPVIELEPTPSNSANPDDTLPADKFDPIVTLALRPTSNFYPERGFKEYGFGAPQDAVEQISPIVGRHRTIVGDTDWLVNKEGTLLLFLQRRKRTRRDHTQLQG